MVEDSLVDLIYGHIYGWRTLVYALVAASVILITVSAVSVYYAARLLIQYVSLVTKISASLIGLIGFFWLGSSILSIARKEQGELEVAKKMSRTGISGTRNFLVTLQLVSIEELEILLIIIPLVVASHALEALCSCGHRSNGKRDRSGTASSKLRKTRGGKAQVSQNRFRSISYRISNRSLSPNLDS